MSPEEDPGLLGNLPRSRPGRRSDKRAAEPREAAPRVQASRPVEPEPDRVGGMLKAAANVAGAGLRMANGMTREVLRRLPPR